MNLNWQQIGGLFVLALAVACVSRTVVYEEAFREPREFCIRMSRTCRTRLARKFFSLFTCEYCFSHWAAVLFMAITGFKLMYADFRGYVIGFFALVLVANFYLNLYSRLRVEITSEKKQIEVQEKEIEKIECEMESEARSGRHGRGDGR